MKTVKFYTLGCKVNQYDTQSIRERFLAAGFKDIYNGKKTDYYVVNTCTVTSVADQKSRNIIRHFIKENPQGKMMVTGCLVEKDASSLSRIKGIDFIISKRFFPDGITAFCGRSRAFLKVQEGCNNFCSYCIVPFVRGASRSRSKEEVRIEAEKLAQKGFKEIVLSGICLGAYGRDLEPKVKIVEIIDELEKIDGLLRIRLSSIEAADVSDGLINYMRQSKKVCRHLHIPIQSGDDGILKRMNRSYTRGDYLRLIQRIKESIPEVAITTDCLVGFPGETDENFLNTLNLIKEILPLKVHIFAYSKRQGTAAAGFTDEVNPKVIKKRIGQLKKISAECTFIYKSEFLGKDMAVLIEGRCKENPACWHGYTDNYIKVLVNSGQDLKNQLISSRLNKIIEDFVLADFY